MNLSVISINPKDAGFPGKIIRDLMDGEEEEEVALMQQLLSGQHAAMTLQQLGGDLVDAVHAESTERLKTPSSLKEEFGQSRMNVKASCFLFDSLLSKRLA